MVAHYNTNVMYPDEVDILAKVTTSIKQGKLFYSFASALHPLRPPPQTWFSSCDNNLALVLLDSLPLSIEGRAVIPWKTATVELLINCKQDFSNLKKICSTVSPTRIQIADVKPSAADISLQPLLSGYLDYKLWKLQTLNLHWWPSTIGGLDILGYFPSHSQFHSTCKVVEIESLCEEFVDSGSVK